MITTCPTCQGRFGGPVTHIHVSRVHDPNTVYDRLDPRFTSCEVCHGRGILHTCDTCDGTGRVERDPDTGVIKPARDVAQMLAQNAMRAWDGPPGHKLLRRK